MAHPLDGVHAKLARADAHLTAIKRAVQRTVDTDPDVIPGEFDKKSAHYVFRAKRDGRHPAAIGPVVGDFVHNIMAALDYLVVPPTCVTAFERLQPFYGPNSDPFDPNWRDPAEEPLWHLYSLDKRDKHSALNLTEDVIATHPVGLERYGIRTAPSPGIVAGWFERGAVIATLDLGDARPDMEVYLSATYDIAFDRGGPAAGEPVVEVLDNIRKEVRQRVLPVFAPYFPPR